MCGVTFAKLSNPSAEFDVTSYPTLKGNSILDIKVCLQVLGSITAYVK